MDLSNLNEDLVLNILILSDRYCMDELHNALLGYLKRNLRIDNVLNILNIAHHCSNNKSIVEECFLLSDKAASEILKQESFLNLSKSALVELLKRDTFSATEEEICTGVINWCKSNENEDIEVIKCLRLSLLTSSELIKLTNQLNDINILSLMKSDPQVELPYRIQRVIDENVCKKLIYQRSETKDGDKETISNSDIIKLEIPSFINYIEMSFHSIPNVSYYINAGVDKSKLERIVDCSSYKCAENTPQFLYFGATAVQFIEIISKDKEINLKDCLGYFTAMYKSNIPKIIDGIICPNYNVATKDKGAKVFLCNLHDMRSTRFLERLIDGDIDRTIIGNHVSHLVGKECFVIQLGQPYLLTSLRLLLPEKNNIYNNYRYYIETFGGGINWKWEMLIDKRNEQCDSWQNINFPSRKIMYFKIVGTAGRRDFHNYTFDCKYFECSWIEKYETTN